MLLALLIATYLLSGLVSTQVSLPALEQVTLRVLFAGLMALPFVSPSNIRQLSVRSLLLCCATSASGYLLAAWSFSYAIVLGGYGTAVFVTSLPWLGLFDLMFNRVAVSGIDLVSLLVSLLGALVFFSPELLVNNPVSGNLPVIFWSLVASISVTFAQYARRFHSPAVKHSQVADGVLVAAFVQACLFAPMISHIPTISDTLWLLVGGACYLLSNRISNKIFAEVSPTKAAVWMSTEPVIALTLSVVFLGTKPSLFQFIGGILLCLANDKALRKIWGLLAGSCDIRVTGCGSAELLAPLNRKDSRVSESA